MGMGIFLSSVRFSQPLFETDGDENAVRVDTDGNHIRVVLKKVIGSLIMLILLEVQDEKDSSVFNPYCVSVLHQKTGLGSSFPNPLKCSDLF